MKKAKKGKVRYKKYKDYISDVEKIYKVNKKRREKPKIGKPLIILLNVLLFIFFINLVFSCFMIVRHFSEMQLDDVNPLINCDGALMDKGSVIMVIPFFENKSIAQNIIWCSYILGLNKTLGMHGVYHSYNEFLDDRNESYVRWGMEEFKKCFGYYPKIFEAPQLALSVNNEKLLDKMGFEVRGWPNMIARKVYHCQDSGIFAMRLGKFKITNKLIDYI